MGQNFYVNSKSDNATAQQSKDELIGTSDKIPKCAVKETM